MKIKRIRKKHFIKPKNLVGYCIGNENEVEKDVAYYKIYNYFIERERCGRYFIFSIFRSGGKELNGNLLITEAKKLFELYLKKGKNIACCCFKDNNSNIFLKRLFSFFEYEFEELENVYVFKINNKGCNNGKKSKKNFQKKSYIKNYRYNRNN